MVDAVHHNLATSVPDLLSQSTQTAVTIGLFFSHIESFGEELSELLRELSMELSVEISVELSVEISVEGAEDGLDEERREESTMMKASPASPQQVSRKSSSLRIGEKSLAALSRPKTARKTNPWPEERSELREMSTLSAPV